MARPHAVWKIGRLLAHKLLGRFYFFQKQGVWQLLFQSLYKSILLVSPKIDERIGVAYIHIYAAALRHRLDSGDKIGGVGGVFKA